MPMIAATKIGLGTGARPHHRAGGQCLTVSFGPAIVLNDQNR
jgi:hypothetical protein